MSITPDTRPSLIARLKDRSDHDAWYEFSEIYRPVIVRLGCRRGMQTADAEDLAQQVLTSVARAIDRWEDDPGRARFRTWLARIATNALVNVLTRKPQDLASGNSEFAKHLSACPADDDPSELIRTEHRREVFRWAARQVRPEFQPETWSAFWLTAVEGQDVSEVARYLHRSPGAIYAARSRVMRRLREKVADWELEDAGQSLDLTPDSST